ncbi:MULTISPECIES: hypothetical protein [unclassified Bradyrhizobium]|uniref:hypothetical protein n=1 Tax=unclassified Bradyrhizobium TaxID=2631580 RepID=UPI0012ECA90B|nr:MULTISPECIES: hypothetical protein [unclassified Bradyrhizobium]QIG94832.1 hypothetical protein G6P99_22065 [Bradyrhizobium sp. 6(2017)]
MRHVDRPRFDAVNRKSQRSPVNETKPALFSTARNDRFAVDAAVEIFAAIVALLAPAARKNRKTAPSHARDQRKAPADFIMTAALV